MPRLSKTALGTYETLGGTKYTDQYGPRTTLRIGYTEALMLREILRTEKDANPQWVVSIGIAALVGGGPFPKYVESKHPVGSPLPQTISFRLTTLRENEVAAFGQQYRLGRTAVLRLAILAAWYSLGCPHRPVADPAQLKRLEGGEW